MFKAIKAFMKPEQMKQFEQAEPFLSFIWDKFLKPVLEQIKETNEIARENNAMLRVIISPAVFKVLVDKKIIKERR